MTVLDGFNALKNAVTFGLCFGLGFYGVRGLVLLGCELLRFLRRHK